MEMAVRAVRQGRPIVICSHSINFIERFMHRSEQGRHALFTLLARLVNELPDLRFASVDEAVAAWRRKDRNWFRSPNRGELIARIGEQL